MFASVAMIMFVTAGATLSEREVLSGASVTAPTTAERRPEAIRKDASTSRSLSAADPWEAHGAEYWHWQLVKAERKVRALERKLKKRWQPTVHYSLRLASVVYGVPYRELEAVARCESNLRPWALNSSSGSAGLFQFIPTTWAGNRLGREGFSVYDPVAASLGAAYHVSRYGWGAWTCRP